MSASNRAVRGRPARVIIWEPVIGSTATQSMSFLARITSSEIIRPVGQMLIDSPHGQA